MAELAKGTYNATPLSLTDGDTTDLQLEEDGSLKVSGSATAGAIDDAAETDPTQDATVIALLKGILEVLNAQTLILTDIETNTGTP